jgi:hypothetical protein
MSSDLQTREANVGAPAEGGGYWPKWLRRGPLEVGASLVISAGVLMLLQPLSMTLYSYSLVTTLAGVVAFMIVSKFPD